MVSESIFMMIKFFKKRVLCGLFLLFTTSTIAPFFDLKFLTGEGLKTLAEGTKRVDFTFAPDSPEALNKRADDLALDLELFMTQQKDAVRAINKNNIVLKNQLGEIKTQMSFGRNYDSDVLNRKITIINDRMQQNSTLHDTWMSIEKLLQEHIQRTREAADQSRSGVRETSYKAVYSLKDLRESEKNLRDYNDRLVTLYGRKESLYRQRITEQENLSTYKKELEYKLKEKERLANSLLNPQDQAEFSAARFTAEVENLDLEIELLRERIEGVELTLRKIAYEATFCEEELLLLKARSSRLTTDLAEIKKRLVVDVADVKFAKIELKNETRKAFIQKDHLNRLKEEKKLLKQQISSELVVVNEQLKKIKAAGEEKTSEGILLDMHSRRLGFQLQVLDKEIDQLDIEKEHAEVSAATKALQYRTILVRYYLAHDKGDVESYAAEFRSNRNLFDNGVKVSKNKQGDALNGLGQISAAINDLAKKREDLQSDENTYFRSHQAIYRNYAQELAICEELVHAQLMLTQKHVAYLSDLIHKQEDLFTQYETMTRELDLKRKGVDLWARSHKAITSQGLLAALNDAEAFLYHIFWDVQKNLGFSALSKRFTDLTIWSLLRIFTFFVLLFFSYFVSRRGLVLFQRRIKYAISIHHGRLGFLWLSVIACVLDFVAAHLHFIFPWLFFWFHVAFTPIYWGESLSMTLDPFFVAFFYLGSIPFLVYWVTELMEELIALNKRLSFFFVTEASQSKVLVLTMTGLYSSVLLLPFRQAFMTYGSTQSQFPSLVTAALSLMVVIIILLCFTKEDVIKLLPSHSRFFLWLKRKIEHYYYPVHIFFMGLLVLANPYVGYAHFAWFLTSAVPATAIIMTSIAWIHYYVRRFSMVFFIREEDDEVIDKFEHAKMYYGFFIVTSFLALMFVGLFLVAHLWGLSYTFTGLWRMITDEWVVRFGPHTKLGFLEILMFTGFVIGGFFLSSLINRYLLNKIFDIFKTEPGAQNTASRIAHYAIIGVSTICACAFINLQQLIPILGTLIIVGVGLGLKDQIQDFFAGLLVLLERQIEIGHFIETDGVIGTVQKIAVRSTTIRTARHFSVVIPNRDLIAKQVINWGRNRYAVGFELNIRVAMESDPEQVKQLIQEALYAHPSILRVPVANVRLEDFNEFGQQFFIRGFISSRKVRDQWEIASDIRIALLKSFRKNGIKIAFPQRVLSVTDQTTQKMQDIFAIKFDPTGSDLPE